MADAENCKPQAKDVWTDAAGATAKEGKNGHNRRQRAKRLQDRRTLVRHKAASRHKQRNTGDQTQAEKDTARENTARHCQRNTDRGMPAGEKPAAAHRHIEPKNKTTAR